MNVQICQIKTVTRAEAKAFYLLQCAFCNFFHLLQVTGNVCWTLADSKQDISHPIWNNSRITKMGSYRWVEVWQARIIKNHRSHISDKKRWQITKQDIALSQKDQERNKISMVMALCNLKAAIYNITASNSTVDKERVSLGVMLYVPSECQ